MHTGASRKCFNGRGPGKGESSWPNTGGAQWVGLSVGLPLHVPVFAKRLRMEGKRKRKTDTLAVSPPHPRHADRPKAGSAQARLLRHTEANPLNFRRGPTHSSPPWPLLCAARGSTPHSKPRPISSSAPPHPYEIPPQPARGHASF